MEQQAKKILILHSSNDMYGASRIVIQVIDILIKAKYEVHVILPYQGVLNKMMRDKGAFCSVYNLGVFRKKYMSFKGLYNRFVKIKKAKNHIANYIKEHQIDLLYTSTSVIIAGGLAAKKQHIPNVYHIHEIPTGNKAYEIFSGLMIRWLSKSVIVVSKSVENHWKPFLKKQQWHMIYNGITFCANVDSAMQTKENKKSITVTSVARLIPYKGHKYFIEVARELLKLNPQYQFLIVGDTFPGYEAYEKGLKSIVALDDTLHQKIHFLGYREDVGNILAKSDLFFHPAIAPDPLPTVLFEAIKVRVPVAATNLGGAVEILDNGNCGLLVPHHKALKAAKLIDAYLKDKTLQQSHSEKATAHTNQFFSTEQFDQNILETFEKL